MSKIGSIKAKYEFLRRKLGGDISQIDWNYGTINLLVKELRKSLKESGLEISRRDFTTMSSDPFYIGSPDQIKRSEWARDMWMGVGQKARLHPRGLHYRVAESKPREFQPNKVEYLNTTACSNYLKDSMKFARYLGQIPFDMVLDKRNPQTMNYADYSPHKKNVKIDLEDAISLMKAMFEINNQLCQPYHIEVFCEKYSEEVLVAKNYGANISFGLGDMSLTSVYHLVSRICQAEKPARIFYISDFDPKGEDMPNKFARKIEWFIYKAEQLEGSDVKVKKLALTEEQCIKYDLPKAPFKDKTESYTKKWEEVYGNSHVELNALEGLYPGELSNIITSAIEELYDGDVIRENEEKTDRVHSVIEEELRKPEVIEKFNEFVKALEPGLKRIEEVIKNNQPAESKLNVQSNENWNYDTGLDFFDQLLRYDKYDFRCRGLIDLGASARSYWHT